MIRKFISSLILILIHFCVQSQTFGTLKVQKDSMEHEVVVIKDSVEIHPEKSHHAFFKGGEDSLFHYIQLNQRYPQEARNNKLNGWVLLSFVIDESGNAVAIDVGGYSHEVFVHEAVRLIEEMPHWECARQSGQKVKDFVSIKISFTLPE